MTSHDFEFATIILRAQHSASRIAGNSMSEPRLGAMCCPVGSNGQQEHTSDNDMMPSSWDLIAAVTPELENKSPQQGHW